MHIPESVLKALRGREEEIRKDAASIKVQNSEVVEEPDPELPEPVAEILPAAPTVEEEFDVVNVNEVRRNWMRLALSDQQTIIKMVGLDTVLPKRVSRFNRAMQAVYDDVFAALEESGKLSDFAKIVGRRVAQVDRRKLNQAFASLGEWLHKHN